MKVKYVGVSLGMIHFVKITLSLAVYGAAYMHKLAANLQ